MNIKFRAACGLLAGSALFLGASAARAQSNENHQETPTYQQQQQFSQVASPSGGMMAFDIVLARPLGLAATVVGTGLFLINLPFSEFESGGPAAPFKALVVRPAKFTFTRPLGRIN